MAANQAIAAPRVLARGEGQAKCPGRSRHSGFGCSHVAVPPRILPIRSIPTGDPRIRIFELKARSAVQVLPSGDRLCPEAPCSKYRGAPESIIRHARSASGTADRYASYRMSRSTAPYERQPGRPSANTGSDGSVTLEASYRLPRIPHRGRNHQPLPNTEASFATPRRRLFNAFRGISPQQQLRSRRRTGALQITQCSLRV